MLSKVDLYRALVQWLKQCEKLQRRLYFTFGEDAEDAKIFRPIPDKPYEYKDVLGNQYCFCTLAIADFKKYDRTPLPIPDDLPQINFEELSEVQEIVDWVEAQRKARNYPDFGDDIIVEDVYTLMGTPQVDAVNDKTMTARYMMTVRVEYVRSEE